MNEKGQGPFFAAIGAGVALVFVLVFLGLRLEGRLGTIERQVLDRAPGAEPLQKLESGPEKVNAGQTVYVPVYSHVYSQGGREFPLEATLSVRNTDPEAAIVIQSVRYFDTGGELVKDYLERPAELGPLASADFLVESRDASGGAGANFLVVWVSEELVSEPIIEAVMIGRQGSQNVSFVRSGRPIGELPVGE